jgi:glycerol-3-phosphate dehydrogenase (NAD(P)+)
MGTKVTVIGSGSWGTTLALLTARKGLPTLLWARTAEEASILRTDNENKRFLPGHTFPADLTVTADLAEALPSDCRLVIFASPTGSVRQNVKQALPYLQAISPLPIVLSAAKGLEMDTLMRISEVIAEEWAEGEAKGLICALSGPNLAKEIADGKPGATVIAGKNLEVTSEAQQIIMNRFFRVYTNSDVIGVELGGALKNIIALGAGLSDGLNAGDNAKGAFMTRGMAEIGRLGVAAGANPLTFLGLAGLGDMVATCASPYSRNRRVGELLAQGKSLAEIRGLLSQVAEGVFTTVAARKMAQKFGVQMPITEQLYAVLFENKPVIQAISELMLRDPVQEMYGF